MRFDSSAIMDMQRKAYAALSNPFLPMDDVQKGGPGIKDGGPTPAPGTVPTIIPNEKGELVKHTKVLKPNPYYVPGKLTSSPGMLVQELSWINTTQTFTFDFSIKGPQQTPGVNNNVTIDKNDVFAIYAIQMLFGTGTNSADFIYRSHGVLPSDDAAYNSVIKIQTESSTYVDKMAGQFFRDNPANSNEYFGEIGMQIINPIRIVSGELGKFNVILELLNPTATLVISPNTVLSMRLHGVYGQAQG